MLLVVTAAMPVEMAMCIAVAIVLNRHHGFDVADTAADMAG